MARRVKDHYDYLIIGNSAGGIGCLEGIRRRDPVGTAAIVSDESHPAYSRPLITHLLAGEVTQEGLAYRPGDYYRRMGTDPILGTRVESLDGENRKAVLAGKRTLSFGQLLLATGGKPIVPPMEGRECDGVAAMISLDDSLAVKKRLPRVRRAVVLGGGLIGAKTAETLSRVVEKVTIVELADRLLGPVTDPVSSRMVAEAFRRHRVDLLTGTTIAGIRGTGKRKEIREVVLRDGTILPCDLLVVAIGVSPRTELAAGSGIKVDRGFVVDQRMETSRPGIYSCGDAAESYDFVLGGMRLLPLWPNAYVGGRVAGLNMSGERTDYRWATNMNSAVFFRLPVISAGLLAKPRGRGFSEIIRQEDGFYAKLVMEKDVVRGLVMAGRVDRAGLYLGLMREGLQTGSFSGNLLSDSFSAAYLPAGARERFREPVRTIA